MSSPAVLHLCSLTLMLFSLYTSRTISTRLHNLEEKLTVLQKLMKKSFWFFIDTSLAYAMILIITFL